MNSTAQDIYIALSGKAPNYTGDDVKRIRLALGLNQAQFAEMVGYAKGKSKISTIEAGDPERGKIQPYTQKLLLVLDKFVVQQKQPQP